MNSRIGARVVRSGSFVKDMGEFPQRTLVPRVAIIWRRHTCACTLRGSQLNQPLRADKVVLWKWHLLSDTWTRILSS